MKEQKESSVYLTAMYLLLNKRAYIHVLKRKTKSNNVPQRISCLRNRHGWVIACVNEGMINGVAVYHYKLIKKGKTPKRYR